MEKTCYFDSAMYLNFAHFYDNKKIFFYPCCWAFIASHDYRFGEIKVEDFLKMPDSDIPKFLLDMKKNKINFTKKPEYQYCEFPCRTSELGIKHLNVSLSRSCNLHCRMCREEQFIDECETDTYYKILYKIKGMHLDCLELTTNGEPFLFKEKLLTYLKTLTSDDTKKLNFITNGTLLDEEYIKELKGICNSKNIEVTVSVSCDSIDEIGYTLTRGGNYFKKVVDNIELLKKYGILNKVLCTITAPILYQLPRIKDFWKNKDVEVEINLANPIRKGTSKCLTEEEMNFVRNSKTWQNYILSK